MNYKTVLPELAVEMLSVHVRNSRVLLPLTVTGADENVLMSMMLGCERRNYRSAPSTQIS